MTWFGFSKTEMRGWWYVWFDGRWLQALE